MADYTPTADSYFREKADRFARAHRGDPGTNDRTKIGDPHIDKAINELDAAMFSGDGFDDINDALVFQKWLHRWQRGLLKKFTPEGQSADYDPSQF